MTLNYCNVRNNTAFLTFGGGIENTGTLTVTGSTFSNNSATDGYGGGINNDIGAVTVSGSTFSNNSAEFGGGIWSDGSLSIAGSTFTSNTADTGGARSLSAASRRPLPVRASPPTRPSTAAESKVTAR